MMRVYIEPYGCTMNYGEAKIMEELLENAGYEITSKVEYSDCVILVTCTVIESTERKMLKRIKFFSDLQKPLIVAGCMASAQSELVLNLNPQAKLLKPMDLNKVVLAINGLAKEIGKEHHRKIKQSLIKPKITSIESIVPISQGCLGKCTYCITRIARGALKSYSLESIVGKIKQSLDYGYRELRLTAQDVGAYGREIGTSLPELLDKINSIKGEYRVRVGMMNPDSVIPILDELINSYKQKKIYKFLHLPVQSGDDEILKKMGRKYTVDEFTQIVEKFRAEYPDLTLSTDIIVGFPTETEAQFEKSCELIIKTQPNIVNIKGFSPRPHTKAYLMKGKIHGREVRNRTRRLSKLRFELSKKQNKKCIGRREEILVTEVGKNNTMIGRTNSYKPVVMNKILTLGTFVKVKIIDATDIYLVSEL